MGQRDGRDSYQRLPGYEKLTMVDHMRAALHSDQLQTDPTTGQVSNPRAEFLKRQIEERKLQERREKEGS